MTYDRKLHGPAVVRFDYRRTWVSINHSTVDTLLIYVSYGSGCNIRHVQRNKFTCSQGWRLGPFLGTEQALPTFNLSITSTRNALPLFCARFIGFVTFRGLSSALSNAESTKSSSYPERRCLSHTIVSYTRCRRDGIQLLQTRKHWQADLYYLQPVAQI